MGRPHPLRHEPCPAATGREGIPTRDDPARRPLMHLFPARLPAAPRARQAWRIGACSALIFASAPAFDPGLAQTGPDLIRPAAIQDLGTGSPPGTVVLVGAGDIANGSSAAEETARLLDAIPGTVFAAGDNAYPDGSASDYATNYEPTWGRHKARTRPCPGNHEYHTANAADYYAYFGANAGPAGRGYYSYDLGDWHIISLNSNVAMNAGSAQEQ